MSHLDLDRYLYGIDHRNPKWAGGLMGGAHWHSGPHMRSKIIKPGFESCWHHWRPRGQIASSLSLWFSYLWNGGNSKCYLARLWWGVNQVINAGVHCKLSSPMHKLRVSGFLLQGPWHNGGRGRNSENGEVAVGGTWRLSWEPKLWGWSRQEIPSGFKHTKKPQLTLDLFL